MKQVKKQETDNEIKDKSLKWWVNLGHEYAAKLRDKYFPDRTLLTADERLKIYLSETKANDKPGGSDTALNPADITPGEWKLHPAFPTNNKPFISNGEEIIVYMVPNPSCSLNNQKQMDSDAAAICTAVNSTYKKGLNPEAFEEVVKCLTRLIDRAEGNDLSNHFPSAIERAKSALQKAKL